MNETAARNKGAIEKECKSKRKPKCEFCGERRAVFSRPYFDIFSDDPKGVVHHCRECYPEGDEYFECATCNRLMVVNYTWELYRTGEGQCLACAAKEYFEDDDNLISPASVKQVVMKKGLPLFKDGVLNIAAARHVLGVKQPLPEGIRFVDNCEFDSTNGHQISGDRLGEIIAKVGKPCFIVLDAAYQWSVSLGVYVKDSN